MPIVSWKTARRVIVLVVGGTVLLIGLALTLLPGPAFVVIPAGLAILATEFVWARRVLERVKKGMRAFPVIGSVVPGRPPAKEDQPGDSCAASDRNPRK